MSRLNQVLTIEPDKYEDCRHPHKYVSPGHPCSRCNGDGYFRSWEIGTNEYEHVTCETCKGSGRLTAEITIQFKPELKNNSDEES